MKKRPQAPALRIAAPDALAERGAADLQAGRFKEAIEAFRRLVRLEPRPDWQHALAAAYAGRARALAAKGMVKEAVLVLDNADGADRTVHEPLLRLACLVRLGDTARAAQACTRLLDAGAPGVSEAERARIADLAAALWLAGHPPTPLGAEGSPSRIFAAAEAALAAWLDGAAADVVEGLLNAIPLRSPFKPLRLILKSLMARTEEPDRRARFLDRVPPDSAFAPLAAAARVAISDDPQQTLAAWGALSPAARSFVAAVSGGSPASAKLLTELGEAEQRGPDAVFDALIRNAARLPAAELRAACLNLLPRVPNRLTRFERQFGPLPAAEKHRILALAAGRDGDWDGFERHWLGYAAALERAAEPDAALLRALVYRHLAEAAVDAPWIARPQAGEDRIAHWLEKSVEADPEDRDGVLKLIARLRETGRTPERHRWAERAAARFPTDPVILTAALEAAAERGAFRKAAALAEKLLAVDPINALARQRLIEFRIAHARKKMRDGRPDLAGKELDEAARWERRDAPDGALAIVRGLVTVVRDGTAQAGWAAVQAGVARLGGEVAGWLRVLLEARAMGVHGKDLQKPRHALEAALQAEPTTAGIVAALSVLSRREFRDGRTLLEGLHGVRHWLNQGRTCATSTAEFQTIAEALERLGAFDLLAGYAKAAAVREPDEPLYDFYAILARIEGESERLTPADAGRLEAIARKAGDRRDLKLVSRIAALVGAGLPKLPIDWSDDDDAFGDPFEEAFGLPDADDADFGAMDAVVLRAIELLETQPADAVVDILVRDVGNGPLGRGVPKAALRAMVTMIVDLAAGQAGGRRRAGRRSRGRR